jgi:hypothetical protein
MERWTDSHTAQVIVSLLQLLVVVAPSSAFCVKNVCFHSYRTMLKFTEKKLSIRNSANIFVIHVANCL